MNKPFLLHITGNPNVPTITKVNIRSQPGTAVTVTVSFQVDVPVRNLPILDVQPDLESKTLNNKVYQWFRVQFPNNTTGWVRDDLATIEGDGTRFGYQILSQAAYAFSLTRQLNPPGAPSPTPPVMNPPSTPAPAPVPPAQQPTPPVTPQLPPPSRRSRLMLPGRSSASVG